MKHKIYMQLYKFVQGKFLRELMAYGFMIYLATIFFLDGNQQKSFFYILVLLPTLFILKRIFLLIHADSKAMYSFVLFLVYFSISALWSEESSGIIDAIKFSMYIICLMLSIEAATCRFKPEIVIMSIVTVGGIAICAYLLAIALSNTELSMIFTHRYALHRLGGWGAENPITSAIVMGVFVIAIWWIFPEKKWHLQLLLAVLLVIGLLLMFITKSRGAILALCMTLLLLTLVRHKQSDLLLLLSGCVLIALLTLLTDIEEIVLARVSEPNYRMEIWLHALEKFKTNWLFGQGFGTPARLTPGEYTHAHNVVFELFRAGGIIGSALFFGMMFFMLRGVFLRSQKNTPFFLAWLVFGLLCSTTQGRLLLRQPSKEWFSFWIPLFLLYFYTRDNTPGSRISVGDTHANPQK
jgi:O-antigen ligase